MNETGARYTASEVRELLQPRDDPLPPRIPFLDLELDRSREAYFQYSGHVAFIIGQPLVQLPRFQQGISTSQLGDACQCIEADARTNAYAPLGPSSQL